MLRPFTFGEKASSVFDVSFFQPLGFLKDIFGFL
jgi:hypothetical protein